MQVPKSPFLILISGPPRSGKNKAGSFLAAYLNGDHFALSDQLKKLTHRHYEMCSGLAIEHFESRKDLPCPEFNGKTPREAYIDFSERVLKPEFGSDYLGRHFRNRLRKNFNFGCSSIVSGVGFLDEVLPLLEEAGMENALHVHVHYDSADHQRITDSRKELDLSRWGVARLDVVHSHPLKFASSVREKLLLLGGQRSTT